jgi:hypothetical protein
MRFVANFRRHSVEDGESRKNGLGDKAACACRLDEQMRTEAIDWVAGHPGRVMQLAGIKFLRLWNVWPNESRYSAWPLRLLVIFTYVPILILGIIGAWQTVRRGPAYWLCWLPAVYLTLVHLIFVSSIRYREPAMLPLIALAAIAVAGRTTEGNHSSSSVWSTSVGSASSGVCCWPPP